MDLNETTLTPTEMEEVIDEYCYNVSNPNSSDINSEAPVFWLEGVALTLTALIGILGNSVTVVVLNRISLSNVFNQLIVMLCIIDSLFAGFSLLEYGLKKGFKLLTYTTPGYVNMWPQFVYPVHNIVYSLSIFVTLAIAIERYMAICHPFLLQRDRNAHPSIRPGKNQTNSVSTTLKRRTCHYMLPVILISVAVNIPKFLEFRLVTKNNVTYIEPSELRLEPDYQYWYLSWIRAILLAFIPFVLLLILNGKIIYQLHEAEKLVSSRATSHQKREAKLARILILIVFFFLFCNVGKLALTLFDLGSLSHLRACQAKKLQFRSPLWVTVMISVNHVLLVMNASANMFLFMVTGTQFRATFLAMLRVRRPPSPITPSKMCQNKSLDSRSKLEETTDSPRLPLRSRRNRNDSGVTQPTTVSTHVKIVRDKPLVEIELDQIQIKSDF